MKKRIFIMLLMLMVVLAGCGQNNGNTSDNASISSEAGSDVVANAGTSAEQGREKTDSNVLVAYFAYSENMTMPENAEVDAITSASLNEKTNNSEGNLQIMSGVVEKELDADVFHILVENPYEMDYSTMLPRAIDEMQNSDYPALQAKIENLEDYDVIFLGTPVWNGGLPPAIHTFLAENDLSGKKVVLFGIHLGSRFGRMESELKELADGIELIDSFTVTASDSNDKVHEEFSEWLSVLTASGF